MLRSLLGEPPRHNEGLLLQTFQEMEQAVQLFQVDGHIHREHEKDYYKFQVWTLGIISSLDELEQCTYAAGHFRNLVHTKLMEDMGPQEKGDYARYVYFYKDGFIRVFSLLDKLATLLNELYHLETAKTKPHYSYFTILRQFEYMKLYTDLGEKLLAIKEEHNEPLSNLRRRRNMEIHYMNAEMQDDLWQKHQSLHNKLELEDLDKHLYDLTESYLVVLKSLHTAFSYTNDYIGRQTCRNNMIK
ncbi:hypothetical protein J2Z69_003125 [Paenibacillus shirakamiensis]|uniref:Cthe-2314-like HEPN domain-containing protein n=1 Tax=Paenibacillus shirakamiensis TaxID=1265935 RepID=A0ABS4JK52_9BACL|nr:Cthe_2314 family HEPN domain-containing protein [Paenibacillus shirakamiensis]MBP2002068.1 hypothetical protein [Paenibacillus shirakamiensis]